jgi:hypothetical protein
MKINQFMVLVLAIFSFNAVAATAGAGLVTPEFLTVKTTAAALDDGQTSRWGLANINNVTGASSHRSVLSIEIDLDYNVSETESCTRSAWYDFEGNPVVCDECRNSNCVCASGMCVTEDTDTPSMELRSGKWIAIRK